MGIEPISKQSLDVPHVLRHAEREQKSLSGHACFGAGPGLGSRASLGECLRRGDVDQLTVIRRTQCYKYVAALYKQLPVRLLVDYQDTVRQMLLFLAPIVGADGRHRLGHGSGCTGSDIWHHFLEALVTFFSDEFDLPRLSVVCELAAEKKPANISFLMAQHDIECVLGDVSAFAASRVTSLTDAGGGASWLPHTRLFGSGFSCTDKSSLNNKSSSMLASVRLGKGSTGMTWDGSWKYVKKVRPVIAFFENVRELGEEYEWQGTSTSDVEFITSQVEEENMSLISQDLDAQERGSPYARVRKWMLLLDLCPTSPERIQAEKKFRELLAHFCMNPQPLEDYFLSDEVLQSFQSELDHSLDTRVPPKKKASGDVGWKSVHEKVCSMNGIRWPCSVAGYEILHQRCRVREAEHVIIADTLWPQIGIGQWFWLDAYLSMEWSFRMDKAQSVYLESLTSPWRPCLPTFVGHSVCVGRIMTKEKVVQFKVLHPLEGFHLMGWDVNLWRQSPLAMDGVTLDDLTTLVGNAWSMFHFIPFAMAAFGCMVPTIAQHCINVDETTSDSSSSAD